MNIAVLLEMVAGALDDRVLVGSEAGGMSGSELLVRSRAVAAALDARPVDRLALVGGNDELVPALLFGAALAGRPYVPVSYRVADDRLRAMLARLAPALVVVDDGVRERVGALAGLELRTWEEVRDEVGARRADVSDAGVGAAAGPDDGAAVWLFTSGTTGEPKTAVLRHQHLSAYVLATVELLAADLHEAALVSVPPYHVAGVAAVLTGVYRGRRTVFLPSFDPEEWVATARSERITHAMVVPTMLGRILDVLDSDGGDLPALRHLSYGGGRMPRPVIERAMAVLDHVSFAGAYGLTETSSTIAVLGPEEHRQAVAGRDPALAARLASVGRPVPGVEVEIRGTGGTRLPVGERGEVFVRGEQVSGEYLRRDGHRAVGLQGRRASGWFPTRDAGRLDAEGYLFLDGRLDDVIVRGGENISPAEIEEVLAAHASVADAAVVGVPDLEWGERIVAAVVAAEGAEIDPTELRDRVGERLRSTRAPEHIEVVDELPYNETGKLLRRVVRDELAARLPASARPGRR